MDRSNINNSANGTSFHQPPANNNSSSSHRETDNSESTSVLAHSANNNFPPSNRNLAQNQPSTITNEHSESTNRIPRAARLTLNIPYAQSILRSRPFNVDSDLAQAHLSNSIATAEAAYAPEVTTSLYDVLEMIRTSVDLSVVEGLQLKEAKLAETKISSSVKIINDGLSATCSESSDQAVEKAAKASKNDEAATQMLDEIEVLAQECPTDSLKPILGEIKSAILGLTASLNAEHSRGEFANWKKVNGLDAQITMLHELKRLLKERLDNLSV